MTIDITYPKNVMNAMGDSTVVLQQSINFVLNVRSNHFYPLLQLILILLRFKLINFYLYGSNMIAMERELIFGLINIIHIAPHVG